MTVSTALACVNCDQPASHRRRAPLDWEPFCCACVSCPDDDCQPLISGHYFHDGWGEGWCDECSQDQVSHVDRPADMYDAGESRWEDRSGR